jgi:septal ring factor EnvC (AmiA/AmiB activator)
MASPEPSDGREFRQMRHDIDDAYRLLTVVQETVDSTRVVVGTVAAAQRRHDTRLEEIQQALDRQAARSDRTEDVQRRQGERLGGVETRLGGVETRLGGVETRLGRIETTQEEQGERLGRIEGAQEGQGERLGRVEGRLDEILAVLRGRSG